IDARKEALPGGAIIVALAGAEVRRMRRPLPRRQHRVDLEAELWRDRVPFVLVGRMQPAAAQIECKTIKNTIACKATLASWAALAVGPGAAPDAIARLDDHNPLASERTRRRNAGRAGTDHRNINVTHPYNFPTTSCFLAPPCAGVRPIYVVFILRVIVN